MEDIENITFGMGPGTRGNTCDICIEVVGPNDPSATHVTCENTFHRSCFDEWTDSNDEQDRSTTCPKCRAVLIEQPLIEPPDSPLEELLESFNHPVPRFPPPMRMLSARVTTTTESAMLDYEMQATGPERTILPTPALFHFFFWHRGRASLWISDYFVRLGHMEDAPRMRALGRILDFYVLMERVLPAELEALLHLVEDEVEVGEQVTDLEIIDVDGNRRLRPSVIREFEADYHLARQNLRLRMCRAQDSLGLDHNEVHQTRREFLYRMDRELARLRDVGREIAVLLQIG